MRLIVLLASIASVIVLPMLACGGGQEAVPPPGANGAGTPPPPVLSVPPIVAKKDAGVGDHEGAHAHPADARSPKYEAVLARLEASSFDETQLQPLKEAFAVLRDLADPRAADGLARLLSRVPPLRARWRTQAGLALGELGDMRALPTLGWRLKQDPSKLYDANKEEERDLRHDDSERVVSARLIADLLALHPDRRDEISKAEDSLYAWTDKAPQPHANAMRALALMGTPRARSKLRAWAEPHDALPKEGSSAFPPSFATAQSALRYIGLAQRSSGSAKVDDDVWQLLNKQLFRRPEKIDITMDELMQGGRAVLGMALRALAVGAAQGFSELGDPRAGPLLVKFIEDQKQNEQSRMEACSALAWVADDALIGTLASKANNPAKLSPKSELVRSCFIETLTLRTNAKASAGLLPLLVKTAAPELRMKAAIAMGSGMDVSLMASLLPMLDNPDLQPAAAVALMLGADRQIAVKAFGQIKADNSGDDAKVAYNTAFNFISDRDLAEGRLGRRVQNAQACGGWAQQIATRSLKEVKFDQGPHSLTRTVLRARLFADASANELTEKRSAARAILEAIGEEATFDAVMSPRN